MIVITFIDIAFDSLKLKLRISSFFSNWAASSMFFVGSMLVLFGMMSKMYNCSCLFYSNWTMWLRLCCAKSNKASYLPLLASTTFHWGGNWSRARMYSLFSSVTSTTVCVVFRVVFLPSFCFPLSAVPGTFTAFYWSSCCPSMLSFRPSIRPSPWGEFSGSALSSRSISWLRHPFS